MYVIVQCTVYNQVPVIHRYIDTIGSTCKLFIY